jgi:hypothetical protein
MRPNLTHTLNPNLKALLLSGLRLKEVIKIRITIKNPYLPLKFGPFRNDKMTPSVFSIPN